MSRQAVSWGVIGNAGVGKSHFIQNERLKNERRQLYVVDQLDQEDLKGVKILDLNETKDIKKLNTFKKKALVELSDCEENFWEKIHSQVRNTSIIYEDAGAIIPRNGFNNKPFKNITLKYRHLGLDLYWVAQNITEITGQVFKTIKYITIFQTEVMYNKEYNLGSNKLIMIAQDLVNKEYYRRYNENPKKAYGVYLTIDCRAHKIIMQEWVKNHIKK